MAVVRVGEKQYEYPSGTLFREIVKELQPQYEDDILLVRDNGKLKELHKELKGDSRLDLLTARDSAGWRTYERSAVFIMLKAFYEVVPRESLKKIRMEFSLDNGIYGKLDGGIVLDEALLAEVKEHMKKLVEAAIPIQKRSVGTDEAISLFGRYGMHDKEQLFRYRRASRVNLYSIEHFEDYFYGYMVDNTSYIKYFDLVLYGEGFLLLLPGRKEPKRVAPAGNFNKLFEVLKGAYRWSERLEVPNVGALNRLISEGKSLDLILMQEALQEKTIGGIAEMAAKEEKRLVMIAGPSSSGKTTFSHRLAVQFRALGFTPHPIAVDNYFRNRVDYPRDENGNLDMESIGCVDIEKFNEDMNALLSGRKIEIPRFNFVLGCREYKGDFLQIGKNDVLIIEGIHCLNDKLSYTFPKENKFKIYINALTQLNIDEHNRIPTADGRLFRRIVRDARTRGHSALETIRQWGSVRRGEDNNIFPFREEADVIFNSALVYELSVLRLYAEPLLFNIPRESEEYEEAKRLLKFLDYFLAMDSEYIPKNSILREFIGGSCLKV